MEVLIALCNAILILAVEAPALMSILKIFVAKSLEVCVNKKANFYVLKIYFVDQLTTLINFFIQHFFV